MASEITKAIKQGNETMQRRNQSWMVVKQAVKTIREDLLPEGASISCDDYGIFLSVPWSMANLRAARLALGNFWELSYKSTQDDGSMTRTYRFSGKAYCSLTLRMDTYQLDPGTCRKVEIGEEVVTYTRKKYKVVCGPDVQTEALADTTLQEVEA